MQFRAHGNWCGPGWTAGQYKDARDLTDEDREVPAVDAIDAACKRHDIGLHDHPEQAYELNEQFRREMKGLGIGAEMMGYLVQNWGPAPAPALSNESTMARGSLRRREDDAPWERQVRPRNNVRTFELEATNVDEVWEAAEQLMDARSVANRPGQAQDSQGTLPDLRDSQLPALMDGNSRDEAMPEAQAQRASGGTGGNQVSKETPISIATPSYGLQETHTTILPWTGWISVAALDKQAAAQLKVRMNTPWDMLDVQTEAAPSDGALPITKGFYANTFNALGRYNNSAYATYPVQFTANATTANERPAWRNYWKQLYEYYTVLGCEWEVIVHNPMELYVSEQQIMAASNGNTGLYAEDLIGQPSGYSKLNTDIVCAVQYDSYSATATTTGNVMPKEALYSEVRSYKNIQWYPIEGGRKKVIRGTYKPGQVKRNIVNDGDVKTWTDTTVGIPPTLSEILTLNFWNDPFYAGAGPMSFQTGQEPNNSGTGRGGCANIEINLKYIVQFKDLRLQARYPTTQIINQDITQTLNESTTVAGSAHQSWTTAGT
nr:MAG: capsid protein [Parvo-like hybrid virus UC4]